MVPFDKKSYSKKLLQLISWSHWFTFFNIIAAIALSSYYLFSETAPTTLIGQAYLITTWVSHIGFLTFIGFVLILFPLILILPHTKFIRTSGSIIFTLGLLLLILDGFIYSQLGYHLNVSSSEQIIELIKDIAQESPIFHVVSSALAITILAFELTLSNYVWKHLKSLQKTVIARFVILALVLSFFFSHFTHIWADANLDYDILRQDTVLPLSYPSTAKTLLTKYGLFNIDDYIERKNSPLSFNQAIPTYPPFDNKQCEIVKNHHGEQQQSGKKSVFLVLTEQQISLAQIEQFLPRASSDSIQLNRHIDTSSSNDAWFSLLYSLPNIYQQGILAQNVRPLLFQALEQKGYASSLTFIETENSSLNLSKAKSASVNDTVEPLTTTPWFERLFQEKKQLSDVSSLLFANKLNDKKPGLHVIYFKQDDSQANQYQFELFVDALLLGQKQQSQRDIIWISALGNTSTDKRLSTKKAIYISSNSTLIEKVKYKELNYNTSSMDLQTTLMKHWLGCSVNPRSYSNGSDLITLKKDRIIANTSEEGIMVFNKNKSVLIDQHGNFQGYSRQLSAPITVNADFPLMIDGVHFIKRFSSQK